MEFQPSWAAGCSVAITVCDIEYQIIEMNEQSAKVFAKDGGRALIGKSLLNCHPEPARSLLKTLMTERRTHSYTIEKQGIKKLIYQTPWYKDGEVGGLVELSMEIPFEMPHFIRQP